MGIEPTARGHRATGFEDQGSHQTPFTSKVVVILAAAELAHISYTGGDTRGIKVFHQGNYIFSR